MDDRATLDNRKRLAPKEDPRTAAREALPTAGMPDLARRHSQQGTNAADAVASEATREKTILVDQAIFTSVRGPTAEGYRIVAATPSVTPAERAEITRRSPSHGSLCDDQPAAVALSTYPLDSGRHCVAVSRAAGIEHTARGGQRIWTHIVVLDDAAYRAFACNPAAVAAALDRAGGPDATTAPPPALGVLRLYSTPPLIPEETLAIGIDWLLSLSRAVLCGEPLLVCGVEKEMGVLGTLMVSLPLSARKALSVSCGLRYSAVRRMQVSIVATSASDARRVLRGQPISVCDIASVPKKEHKPHDEWLPLLGRWLERGRMAEIASLTAAITGESSPAALNCLARIWTCMDAVGETEEAPIPSAAL